MQERPAEITETKSQPKTSLTSLVPAGKFDAPNGETISLLALPNGDIAMLTGAFGTSAFTETLPRLRIYNGADLSKCKADHNLSKDVGGFTVCPNGDVTVNKNKRRVLIDAYTLESKKNVGEEIDYWTSGFHRACPINDDQYIVLGYQDKAAAIRVYDSKTHEHKTTLNILAKLKQAEINGIENSYPHTATFLQNGKTALTFGGDTVVLFRYSDEKISDVMRLDYNYLNIEQGMLIGSSVLPFSDERILTIISYRKTGMLNKQNILQFWDSNTGERLGEPFMAPEIMWASKFLPDGSMLGFSGMNQICIIDKNSLRPSYYDMGCHIKSLEFLGNDQVVIVSHPRGAVGQVEFDIRIIELEHLLKAKQLYIKKEILAATDLAVDVVDEVTQFIGCDIYFPKNQTHPATFFLPAPKTAEEIIVGMMKLFSRDIITLQHFFVDNFDVNCLRLLCDLREEIEKSHANTIHFAKKLKKLCEELEKFETSPDKEKYSKFTEKLNKLNEDIEQARAEEVALETVKPSDGFSLS